LKNCSAVTTGDGGATTLAPRFFPRQTRRRRRRLRVKKITRETQRSARKKKNRCRVHIEYAQGRA
jgi:hypothetical protein